MPNSFSISFEVREEVGSSMAMMRALTDSALAISTSCFSATLRFSTFSLTPKSNPRRLVSSAASSRTAFQSMSPPEPRRRAPR